MTGYAPTPVDLAQTYKDTAAQMEYENMTDRIGNLLSASPAPRVTEDKVASVIVSETFAHRLVGTLTICVLTLQNGFTVVGKSACASPENYNEEVGEHFAREDARRQIWPLEAYLLKQRVYEGLPVAPTTFLDRLKAERAELVERLDKLTAFFDTDKYRALPGEQAELLDLQHAHMNDYAAVLDKRLAAL